MPQVTVVRAFDLVRQNGTEQRFLPGVQEISAADLEHWHVKANLDTATEMAPRPGSYEYHTLHPQLRTAQATEADHALREAAALREEDAMIAEGRAKAAAQRREDYQAEMEHVRAGGGRRVDPQLNETFGVDPSAATSAYQPPAPLTEQSAPAIVEPPVVGETTPPSPPADDADTGTEEEKKVKRETLKKPATT